MRHRRLKGYHPFKKSQDSLGSAYLQINSKLSLGFVNTFFSKKVKYKYFVWGSVWKSKILQIRSEIKENVQIKNFSPPSNWMGAPLLP